MSESTAFAYVAIKKEEGQETVAYACGDKAYIDTVVQRWRSGADPEPEEEVVVEPELPLSPTQEAALADALKKAVTYALSQSHVT
jgi:hypothetical protein